MKKPLIIMTGPTAVGKTSLSVQLAKKIHGEVISADSMQVYRHMDIGTAKITEAEMEGVYHHLIDVMEPTEEFNVVLFQKMAKEAIEKIYSRGNIPIIAGGTGFYIQALLYDINFQEPVGDFSERKDLEQLAAEKGCQYLHHMLCGIDPVSAEKIPPANVKRVIRAIEYYKQTGEPISIHNEREQQRKSPYDFLYYVIHTDRKLLYERIENRVDQMIACGLTEEVQRLKEQGCTNDMVSMQGIGYKEISSYLDGRSSMEEAVETLKKNTRHFAKRQITWFKRERQVNWLNLEDFSFDQNKILKTIVTEINHKYGLEN